MDNKMYDNNLIQKNVVSEAIKISSRDLKAWDRRIQSIELHLKEDQVSPIWFDKICEKTTKTIFNVAEGTKSELVSRALWKAITELSPNQRKIIHLIFSDGLSEQEIANAIKIPRKTISNRKFAAFREIEKKCGQFFLSYEGTSFKKSNPNSEIQPQSGVFNDHKITGEKNE